MSEDYEEFKQRMIIADLELHLQWSKQYSNEVHFMPIDVEDYETLIKGYEMNSTTVNYDIEDIIEKYKDIVEKCKKIEGKEDEQP